MRRLRLYQWYIIVKLFSIRPRLCRFVTLNKTNYASLPLLHYAVVQRYTSEADCQTATCLRHVAEKSANKTCSKHVADKIDLSRHVERRDICSPKCFPVEKYAYLDRWLHAVGYCTKSWELCTWLTALCLGKKRHPFYFCDNLVRCHSILPIISRNIPQGIWNKIHI